MFVVTAPRTNAQGVLESKTSIVDRMIGTTLYEATEFILDSILGKYHGMFLAKPGHAGLLACGSLGPDVYAWRSANTSTASWQRYVNADASLVRTVFPDK